MEEWILVDDNLVVELGRSAEQVEAKLLGLLLAGKLSRPNAIVDIASPHEVTVSVGVADGRAYVEFGTRDGDPPYSRVVSQSGGLGREELVFMYKGERTPLPARNCVSLEELAGILKHFIATESIPEWINLEEV